MSIVIALRVRCASTLLGWIKMNTTWAMFQGALSAPPSHMTTMSATTKGQVDGWLTWWYTLNKLISMSHYPRKVTIGVSFGLLEYELGRGWCDSRLSPSCWSHLPFSHPGNFSCPISLFLIFLFALLHRRFLLLLSWRATDGFSFPYQVRPWSRQNDALWANLWPWHLFLVTAEPARKGGSRAGFPQVST